MRNHTIIGTLILSTTIVLGACDKKAPQPPLSGPTPVAPQGGPAPIAPGAQELPPGHPPLASDPAMPSPAGTPAATPAGDLGPQVVAMGATVTIPDGWKRQTPASSMRIAEVVAPSATGEASALAVFSTAGGSVEENVVRWSGQVRGADGAPVPPKSETKTVDGMTVTVVEMTGTLSGMGIDGTNANWTLRGAIVQAPQGLLFIKMYGPAKTMADQAAAFTTMVDSIKKS